jgi:hypothetical protein
VAARKMGNHGGCPYSLLPSFAQFNFGDLAKSLL